MNTPLHSKDVASPSISVSSSHVKQETAKASTSAPWSQQKADFAIALVAILWGSSYLMMKAGLESIPPYTITALRFCIAFLSVALIFHKKLKNTTLKILRQSAVMGFFLFGIFAFLMHGISSTTASNAGFLISTSVVMVPILHAFSSHVLPDRPTGIGILVTAFGIGLLTLGDSFSLSRGDLLCITGATMYALQILLADRYTKKTDGLLLGIWQLGFAGLFSLLCAIFFETPVFPHTAVEWAAVLGLAIICSAFGFVVQPVAQQYTTPEHAALLFALEPVSSAVFAFLFLHEVLTVKGYIGAAMVLCGVLIASLFRQKPKA